MAKFYSALLCLVLASVLISSATVYGITPSELKSQIKSFIGQQGLDRVDTVVGGNFSSIDDIQLSYNVNTTTVKDFWISQYGNLSLVPIVINGTVTNGTAPPPPPKPVEVCGDGIDNDGDGLVDEGCPVLPPSDKPSVDVNTTKTLRIAVVGDIDNNGGLDTQIALAKKYNVDTFVVPGDYCYHSCSDVLNTINSADFDHVAIVCGNHDDCKGTATYMKMDKTYGQVPDVDAKLGLYLINGGNDGVGFDCSSAQYAQIQDQLSSSDAWYNIPVIHQPFATVKNDHHGPNGQFNCYDPLFRGNGVQIVLQAHVHNYQRIDVNGINYGVFGTGTHDTGGSMYSCDSDNWAGHEAKCITGTNGITLIDLQIDDPNVRHMDGWFLDMNGNVKDKFN
jgi:predicted phosphodiesterase